MDALTTTIIEYRYYLELLAIVIATITAISSFDDAFVDLYYWSLKLLRHGEDKEFARAICAAGRVPERPFAIMIPAWKEHDVISSMVVTNSRLLAYQNYQFFIGVYRNDQRTIEEVRRTQALYANVHMAIVPRDGPTSKADCLNVVLAEIESYEARCGTAFAGIALHDAEDFIHPHELQVFNAAVGEYDFVQLPVFSFSQPLRDVVGGIYMDEFAEVHVKDLTVRKHLSGLIPCAGVSACFSREAIARLAASNNGEVFRTSCFTEDYDIAFRLRALGLKSTFLSCPVNYTIDMDQDAVTPMLVRRTLPVATREFFPSELRGAYRQRARWLIGIVFQGTASHGWKGNWGTRYFLARDRKGIITSPTVMLGYFVLANLVLIALYLEWFANGRLFDYVLLSRNYVMDLFFLNLGFLSWRILHRMIFTTKIYDLRQGLMAAPRLIVANFVNFFATMRAVRIYSGHLIMGNPLVWDKTAHSYPFALRRSEPPAAQLPPPRDPGQKSAWTTAGAAPFVSAIALVALLDLFPMPFDEAHAQSGSAAAAQAAGSARPEGEDAQADIRSARAAVAADPATEQPVRALIDALSRAGRKREALVEADRFAAHGAASAALRAQRGFLRRALDDIPGGIEDFAAALAGNALAAEQRRNVEGGLAEAQRELAQRQLDAAQKALTRGNFDQAADAAGAILRRAPGSEAAIRIRVAALAATGRKRKALAELDHFMAHGTASSTLRAQRGFLRREFDAPRSAAEDFSAALADRGLATAQRHNIEAGLTEARSADLQEELDRAQAALKQHRFDAALEMTGAILQHSPGSEAAMRIRIEALTGAGFKHEAQAAMDRVIAGGHARGWIYASRGFTRRAAGDPEGAVNDFDAALACKDLEARSIPTVRFARAETAAALAERAGKPQDAEAAYREVATAYPGEADGWFKLGYLLLKHDRRLQGAQALQSGLDARPVARAYFDAASPYIAYNALLASQLYRQGLDRWRAGDPSLADASASDIERVRNEVVVADASIATTLSYGGIAGRPEAAGGHNNVAGAETTVRFDGRYLAAVPGLEAFARGLSGKDATGATETDAGAGVRYRPIRDLNLYVGGLVDHFFAPTSRTEPVLIWGLGLGADAYPYLAGWKPYWDAGTFGAWRTADKRVLEDTRANAGFLYEFRTPVRAAIGPTLLAVAGYDNLASTPWAGGIGPSVLSYFWLGGDEYRSYDCLLFLQLGYLINVGPDARQRGWRGQVGVKF
jgi:bacteriophage N4 adsorption protein B